VPAESPFPPAGSQDGRVSAFDQRRGIGSVTGLDGTEWFFHATAISDGSRAIAVGTPVHFRLEPGHGGRYEARAVTPLGS
jgi:cold shock CspA family protein